MTESGSIDSPQEVMHDIEMEFEIDTAGNLDIEDSELSELLTEVYVEGGFTRFDEAEVLFDPSSVRRRGTVIGARDRETSTLAGMVIVVPPGSEACRLAKDNEAEMHLLGVKPDYRGRGLGKRLIEAALSKARSEGYSRMMLWTQLSMKSAQKLYQSSGFSYIKTFERNGREFLVYDRELRNQ